MRRLFAALAASLFLLAACGKRDDTSTAPTPSTESAATAATSATVAAPTENEAVSTPEPAEPADGEASAEAPPTETPPTEAPSTAEILTITVPEGYTLARIGMLLEERGVCTVDAFIAAAQEGDYNDYPLVAAQPPNPNRCFALEGYLFPDTYEIYSNDTPDAVIRKMLEHLESKLGDDIRGQIQASGYTVDEVLAMASIIEKEAFGHEQMPAISSVLHNRLDTSMRLQCDVTITYVEGAIKPFITGDIDRYNAHYNTYKCDGLPAGAICNPGMDAIRAALAPADTDYLFFVTDADQNYYYAETWEGHQENLEKAGLGE